MGRTACYIARSVRPVPGSDGRHHSPQADPLYQNSCHQIVFSSSNGTSTRITRSALVPFSGAQMYRLVADVPKYPQFLPWCRAAHLLHTDDHCVRASLTIAKGPLHKSFTTRNRLFPEQRIEIALVDGPFRHLNGCWSFDDLGGEGARVTLDMDFEIAGALLRRTLQPIFAEIANTMVDAFCQRARDVYRPQ